MTVVIAVVFIVCWTPYNTIVVWFMIDKESFRSAIIDQRLQNTLFLFACLSSVMDPIVYGFFHVRNNSRRPSQVKFKYSPRGAVMLKWHKFFFTDLFYFQAISVHYKAQNEGTDKKGTLVMVDCGKLKNLTETRQKTDSSTGCFVWIKLTDVIFLIRIYYYCWQNINYFKKSWTVFVATDFSLGSISVA